VRKGLQTLEISFAETGLTHFGGMLLIQRFCNQLKIRRRLQRVLRLRNIHGEYPGADMILALMFAVIAGLRRINKTEILQYNGPFLTLLGLKRFPDQSTLRRFLQRQSPNAIRRIVRVHDQLRQTLLTLPPVPNSLVFDLDSVVLTLYGKQQGARVGYNPKKHGRRSYHPLLCFETQRQEFWHGSLRPGNAACNTGAIPFMRHCLDKAPSHIARSRIRVRADAGFFGHRFVEFLDQMGCGYVIVAREYKTIRSRAYSAHFHLLRLGWEVAEFRYCPVHWRQKHRFVVIRRPIPEDPAEAKQLTLFKDRRYAYSVLVTNLRMSAWRVWRFYCPRATVEKNIRELLYDLPLGKIPTAEWIANVAFFQLILFAYNLVHWFKRLCLPPDYLHSTIETVRTDFLMLPARLTRTGHRNILHLPRDYHYRDSFAAAFKKVQRLRLPSKK